MAPPSRIFVPTDSTEYIAVKVVGTLDGIQIDLSSTPVEVGIRSITETVGGFGPLVFKSADWEYSNGFFYARTLIGPEGGAFNLPVDTYNIWVKIFADPQLIIRKSPTILEIRPAETQ